MTSQVNLPLHGGHQKIYLVYDFNQVSDAILMIMYNAKSHAWDKTLLNYEHGSWMTSASPGDTDAETLNSLQKKLKRIIPPIKKTYKDYLLQRQELSSHHTLMLLDACS